MVISFVSSGKVVLQTNGNATPDLPPVWAVGDLFVCVITSLDNVNSTMPSGWTAIEPGKNNGAGLRTTVYYKIAEAGEDKPDITHYEGKNIVAAIVAYRGVDQTSPLDVIGTTRVNASSTTVTATSITTLSNNDWVIFTGGIASRSTFSSYSGTPTPTERLDVPNTKEYPSIFVADFAIATAGSTGNRTCIATTAAVNNGLMLALRPAAAVATVICITDPTDAYVYIDGVLQLAHTSISISVPTGNHTITFYKPGYDPYTESISLAANAIVKVAAILTKRISIKSQGIVICSNSNIISCPISAIDCPIQVTPLNYINFMVVLESTSPTSISLTVRFIYSADGISHNQDVYVTLPTGTSIVYAFPTNQQYSPDTILSLDNVILI